MPLRTMLAAVLAAVLAVGWSGMAAQPAAQAASVCSLETPERIVAIGDIHGGYAAFVGVLRAAGLVDGRERWSGGGAVLVQTGDVVDRGADSKRALDLLRRLERDAARAGGRVHALLGNHEIMRMVGDWRYVSAGEYAAFRNADSMDLRERLYAVASVNAADRAQKEGKKLDEAAFREQFLKDIPLGAVEMQQAFGPTGDYGRWLRTHDTVVKINGVVFVHGGISPAVAMMGCEAINATVRKDLAVERPAPEAIGMMLASSEMGPVWYRGLAEEPEETFAPGVTAILDQLGARAIVIGHTVALGRIRTRFGGTVVQIDTGLLNGDVYPGGSASALEIRGESVTAIYPDRREPLRLAARQPAAAAR
jgi:hypothetical protein